jgi:hypothetical protein
MMILKCKIPYCLFILMILFNNAFLIINDKNNTFNEETVNELNINDY